MCVSMCVKPVLTSIGNVSISLDFRLYYLHAHSVAKVYNFNSTFVMVSTIII